jgi:hypothetical protein
LTAAVSRFRRSAGSPDSVDAPEFWAIGDALPADLGSQLPGVLSNSVEPDSDISSRLVRAGPKVRLLPDRLSSSRCWSRRPALSWAPPISARGCLFAGLRDADHPTTLVSETWIKTVSCGRRAGDREARIAPGPLDNFFRLRRQPGNDSCLALCAPSGNYPEDVRGGR